MVDQPTAKCVRRLANEIRRIEKEPVPNAMVRPDEDNVLDWYFVVYDLKDDYEGGYYFGKISFPKQYPFKAPTLKFITPNGRFEENKTICTTFTHYHPEQWSPEWNTSGMLLGMISFMYEESDSGVGSIKMSKEERLKLAKNSMDFNRKNKKFVELFGDLLGESKSPIAGPSNTKND